MQQKFTHYFSFWSRKGGKEAEYFLKARTNCKEERKTEKQKNATGAYGIF